MSSAKRGSGLWCLARDLLAAEPAKAFSVKEVAEAIDFEPFEVRSVLSRYARAGKLVRVVTVEPGPIRFRIVVPS